MAYFFRKVSLEGQLARFNFNTNHIVSILFKIYENKLHTLDGEEDAEEILDSLDTIYTCFCSLGNYKEAINLCKEVLALRENKHGKLHASYISTYMNLGKIYRLQGTHERETQRIFEECLDAKIQEIHSKLSEELHPYVNHLGALYRAR